MESLKLVDFWEYYYQTEQLDLSDVISLLESGDIALKDGLVSTEDLRTLVNTLRLKPFDERQLQDQVADSPSQGDEDRIDVDDLSGLRAQAGDLEKQIYALEKSKASIAKGREWVRMYSSLCDVLGKIAFQDAPSTQKAISAYRKLLQRAEEHAVPIKEYSQAYMRLADLLIMDKKYRDAVSVLETANRVYRELNDGLSITRIRERSQFTLQLGVIYVLLFKAKLGLDKNPQVHLLEKAETCFASARDDGTVSRYIKELVRLRGNYDGGE